MTTEVLGKHTFSEVPDVNGSDVLLNAGGTPSVSSDALANRPPAGTAGRLFVDTTNNVIQRDTGSVWADLTGNVGPVGRMLQMVTGTIANTSTNNTIPYDNSTPLSSEGLQIWSQSFTPISASSTILIVSYIFWAHSSAAQRFITSAHFEGTVNIGSWTIGSSDATAGSTQAGAHCSAVAAESTTARTYSCRVGANSAAGTLYIGQGTGGQTYGGAANCRFVIMEVSNG